VLALVSEQAAALRAHLGDAKERFRRANAHVLCLLFLLSQVPLPRRITVVEKTFIGSLMRGIPAQSGRGMSMDRCWWTRASTGADTNVSCLREGLPMTLNIGASGYFLMMKSCLSWISCPLLLDKRLSFHPVFVFLQKNMRATLLGTCLGGWFPHVLL
jgi:hypothetical protein